MNDGRVVSNFIVQALREEEITIFGDGTQTRSFCYVDDLVEGLITFMEEGGADPGPINLGNPHEITMLELADEVLKLTGSKSRIVYRDRPADDPAQRMPDISKARAALSWEPKVSLEDGLKETIRYFRSLL